MCCFSSAYACDFCGCSPAVMNTDVLSIQPQTTVGTSLQYKNFKHLVSDANVKRTQILTQTFFVSYAPKKWVDIRLSMPLIWMFNQYKVQDKNTPNLQEKKFGVGDLLLFSNFRVFTKPGFGTKKVGHIVNLGYGMSFPTGSKKASTNVWLQDFNFGTQMVAFYFSGTYSMSIKNWSLVNTALVKLNMYNKDKVKYGNMYSYQLAANYTRFVKQVALTPIVGIRTDISQKNLSNKIIQSKSGGYTIAANIGLQCAYKEFAINVSVSQPMAQKLSAGNIQEKTGFNCMVLYQIKNKTKVVNEIKEPISSQPKTN